MDLVKKTGSEVLLGHVVEAVGLVPLVWLTATSRYLPGSTARET